MAPIMKIETMLNLSAITVLWNSPALLEQCLRSLYETLGDCLTGRVSVVDYKKGSAATWDQLWKNQECNGFLDDNSYIGLCGKIKFESFKKVFLKASGRKSLECGCGLATISTRLAMEGYEVTMLDLSSHALEKVKSNFKRLGLVGDFVQDDINDMPFKDKTFDLVLSFGVLEHFKDINKPIEEMVRVLRPGGIFFADIVPRKFSIHKLANMMNYLVLFSYFVVKLKFRTGYKFFKNRRPKYFVNSASLNDYLFATKMNGLEEIKSGGYSPFPSFILPKFLRKTYLDFIRMNTNFAMNFNLSESNLSKFLGFGWWVTGRKSF